MKGQRSRHCNIELGLAISALSLLPGQTRNRSELAAFCGCSRERIRQIENRALRKIRFRLRERLGKEYDLGKLLWGKVKL